MLLFAFITLSLAAFDNNFCVGYTQSGDKEIRNICATSHLRNDGECVVTTPKMRAKMQDAGKLNGCDQVSGGKWLCRRPSDGGRGDGEDSNDESEKCSMLVRHHRVKCGIDLNCARDIACGTARSAGTAVSPSRTRARLTPTAPHER